MKEWLKEIASDIEKEYGKEARDRIFGDIQAIADEKSLFHQFIKGMDDLNDKSFLTNVMSRRCPCRHIDLEENIRKNYAESDTLEQFAESLDKDGLFDDTIALQGNILTATKRPFEKHGTHNHKGPYTKKCHCQLGSTAQHPITDIFCHCCTVGFYGKMFENALDTDVKVELIESVISGGECCTAAIHLPEK